MNSMIRVMFVCLGNICRSPLAEAVFNNKIAQSNLSEKVYVESCGTAAYHVGEQPDPRTINVAHNHGIAIHHKAQQLKKEHFVGYDYLIFMDESNVSNAAKITPTNAKSIVFKLRDFDSINKGADVADPWFGEEDGFEECYQVVDRCCGELLHFLVNKHNLTLA